MDGREHCSHTRALALSAHLLIVYELVHPSGAQRGTYRIDDSAAGINVANELSFPLAGVCALFQQDDLRLLHRAGTSCLWDQCLTESVIQS